MSTVPLKADILEDGLVRPRDWEPRRNNLKIPLRLVRLCILGTILPAMLVAGPIYLRYRVYSEQLYPLSASDQRLIDGKVSTTWCQKQVVKVNATFNAYLMQEEPEVKGETIPVSMTRHLILEDDMKEYWGFYLLRGSSVTVSTCVRWPGASLTIIRGHKNLHECAFIGDDSSEELEELLEIAEERGHLNLLNSTLQDDGPSNEPDKMKRARQEVLFHHKDSTPGVNNTLPGHVAHHYNSHELDAKAMRNILTQLFMKTLDTKKKQEETPHHHYEGVFMDSANIEKPPVVGSDFPYTGDSLDSKEMLTDKESFQSILDEKKARKQDALVEAKKSKHASREGPTNGTFEADKMSLGKQLDRETLQESSQRINTDNKETLKYHSNDSTIGLDSITEKTIMELAQQGLNNNGLTSAEVFQDVLKKIRLLGERGKHVLARLVSEIDNKKNDEAMALRKIVKEVMNGNFSEEEIKRRKRDLILSSPLHDELTQDDSDGDAAIEEGMLNPDGIAEDRGTVNETTLNDRSNSEFWSSFSSSEERLLECKGLILNLPLTPHRHCAPKYEKHHSIASFANTVTYRVPMNGYYFFVFSSENEIQPNYVRIHFDLMKTMYNTSNSVHACENSTQECSLPLNFFSGQKTVLELPLNGNESQWNHDYVVVSTCEPRTAIYLLCIIAVPILILVFAFH